MLKINLLIIFILVLFLSFLLPFKDTKKLNYSFMSMSHTNIVKGIGIILIVIHHIGQVYAIHLTDQIGPLGVFLFLAASGYGINESFKKRGLDHYLIKRIKKVFVPYWVLMIFLIGIFMISDFPGILEIAQQLLMIHLFTGFYWFLQLIAVWYIAFFVTGLLIQNSAIRTTLLFAAGILITWFNLDNQLFSFQIFSFPFGVLISNYKEWFQKRLFNKPVILVLMLAIGIAEVLLLRNPTFDSHYLTAFNFIAMQVIFNFSFGMFLLFISYKHILKFTKIIIFASSIAYEIYLIHPLFLNMVNDQHKLVMIEFIVVIVALAYVLNRIVYLVENKLPYRSWMIKKS